MGMQLVSNALLTCTFGVAPSTFMVLPANMVMAGGMPAANIMDYKPMVNILPFGMCNSMANPTVAAATAAAFGVLTPMPCIPNTTAPWMPGVPTVMIANQPALNDSCKLMCMWGGMIAPSVPGQFTVQD